MSGRYDRPAAAGRGGSRGSIARSCPYPPHAVPRLRRGLRRRDLPPAGGGAARNRAALRGEGQPRPDPAGGAGGVGLPVRRGQPGRDHRRLDGRRRAGRPRLLQPGEAARGRAVRGPARRGPVRRRLPRRGRQGRRGRARQPACCAGSSPRATGRTGRCRASTAARPARPSRSCVYAAPARPACRRGLLPRRLPAARPRGLGRPDRRGRHGLRDAPRGRAGRRGCWTSAAASRPGSTTAARHPRRTAPRSSGTWPTRSATAGPTTIAEPGRGIAADAGVLVATVRRRRAPRRHPLGLPRRRRLHRAGRDPRRGDPLPAGHRRSAARPARACSPGPTCDSADVLYEDAWSSCRWRWPRATRCGSTVPASTRRRTRRSASTASRRSRRSSRG